MAEKTVICENKVASLGAYFFEGERRYERCRSPAKWIVSVNPPSKDSDGKIRLCNHCNRFDYTTFPRAPLSPAESRPAENTGGGQS